MVWLHCVINWVLKLKGTQTESVSQRIPIVLSIMLLLVQINLYNLQSVISRYIYICIAIQLTGLMVLYEQELFTRYDNGLRLVEKFVDH
jgi:hypothetical protein